MVSETAPEPGAVTPGGDVNEALADQVDALAAIVQPLDADGLRRPSLCPGWSVADVLLHLAQTNEMAAASVTGTFDDAIGAWVAAAATGADVDGMAGAVVDAERGDPVEARDRWAASAQAMVAGFVDTDPAARVPWVAGEMAARTLATTRIAETWIHTEDIARGLGIAQAPTDRLWHVARLVHRTLPYAFAQAGLDTPGAICFALNSPEQRSSADTTWRFGDHDAPTVIHGPAQDLCWVAGQRADASTTALRGEGPDAEAALRVMRTYA